MTALLGTLLLLLAAFLAVPCLVLLVQCLAAAWLPARDRAGAGATRPTSAVIVPAHDEELGIAATVAALVPQLAPGDRLLVVADNCSDGTAAAARAAGATVIERSDPERRGKGFALVFALDHLAEDPPDVVIVIDADCRLSAGGLALLAAQAAQSGRPAQGDYVLGAPASPTARGALSALAVLVRNRVRPLGMRRLGLPCQLTGSGMAFPFQLMRGAPHLGANLVEDLVMGLELALDGHPPLGCPEVAVTSELPEGDDAAMSQRRRWEHGQLGTLLRYGPRLILAGLGRANLDLLGLGLDLCVPPLALLAMLLMAAWAGAVVAALLGVWALPAGVLTAAIGAVAVAVLVAWWRFGRDTLPFRALVAIPLYVLWKIPLYLALLLRRKQKSWDRTRRKGEGPR